MEKRKTDMEKKVKKRYNIQRFLIVVFLYGSLTLVGGKFILDAYNQKLDYIEQINKFNEKLYELDLYKEYLNTEKKKLESN